MDRNTIIGLVLIAGIVLTWSIFFAGGDKDDPAKKPGSQVENVIPDTNAASQPGSTTASAKTIPNKPLGMADSTWLAMGDSAQQVIIAAEKAKEHGDFSKLYEGEDKVIEVQTDKYDLVLHTKGARMGALHLRSFMTSDSHPLPIQTDNPINVLAVNFKQKASVKYPGVSTSDLYFEPGSTSKVTVSGGDSAVVSLKAKIDEAHYIEYVYTFRGDDYDYGLELKQVGLNELIERQAMDVVWQTEIPKTEKTMELMREKTALYYRESGSVDDLGPGKSLPIDEPVIAENHVDWVAFHSQFFTHTLLTEQESGTLDNAKFWQATPLPPDPDNKFSGDVVKLMSVSYDLPIATQPSGSVKYMFYAGPLDFGILKTYDRDMIKQIGLGWGPLKWVNRFLTIPIFNFLRDYISNYGLIILLLGLIIKTLIYPLTYRTYISTTRMRLVNNTPEVKELEIKYKDDPTKLQQEKMAVSKKYGVSMFGGCWPMLVQYPFMIALFFFFPNSIELRQQSFWWAPDLSTYDSIYNLPFTIPFYGDHVSLFTLLMTASIFAYTIINQKMQPQQVANPVMKWFPYIMPIILLGFLNRYSAGLSWYYLLSNLISISQTLITRRFVNEDKLFAEMVKSANEKASDPNKKKGTLERWAERQQQRQRDVVQQRQDSRGDGPSTKGPKMQPPKKRR